MYDVAAVNHHNRFHDDPMATYIMNDLAGFSKMFREFKQLPMEHLQFEQGTLPAEFRIL